jgi:hypothetical protein
MTYGTGYSNYIVVPDPPPRHFLIGLDLGQARDATGIVVVERLAGEGGARYQARNIQRVPLGTSYPHVVRHVGSMIGHLGREHPDAELQLVIDGTGCGRPVVDLFLEAEYGCPVVPVGIHGGSAVSRDGRWLSVPKRDLVGTVRVLLESERLRIAAGDPLAAALTAELTNFRVTISKGGHDSYGAGGGVGGDDWRDGAHDDLVLALALACWVGEQRQTGGWEAPDPEFGQWFRDRGIAVLGVGS